MVIWEGPRVTGEGGGFAPHDFTVAGTAALLTPPEVAVRVTLWLDAPLSTDV